MFILFKIHNYFVNQNRIAVSSVFFYCSNIRRPKQIRIHSSSSVRCEL